MAFHWFVFLEWLLFPRNGLLLAVNFQKEVHNDPHRMDGPPNTWHPWMENCLQLAVANTYDSPIIIIPVTWALTSM